MAKTTIELKSGAVITIEGDKEEVADIVSRVTDVTSKHKPKRGAEVSKDKKSEKKRRPGATDLILELREEGFFEKARTLGEIETALREKGCIYPVTTLSGIMIHLVQDRMLGRKKLNGKWVYGN